MSSVLVGVYQLPVNMCVCVCRRNSLVFFVKIKQKKRHCSINGGAVPHVPWWRQPHVPLHQALQGGWYRHWASLLSYNICGSSSALFTVIPIHLHLPMNRDSQKINIVKLWQKNIRHDCFLCSGQCLVTEKKWRRNKSDNQIENWEKKMKRQTCV